MRLTSRDEGGGRGGGGKEEKGGVDELHFYLGLGLSWTINCLDCDKIGGRLRAKKHGEEQRSCVISQQISAWRVARAVVAPSARRQKTTRQSPGNPEVLE